MGQKKNSSYALFLRKICVCRVILIKIERDEPWQRKINPSQTQPPWWNVDGMPFEYRQLIGRISFSPVPA
jgi:hypothetical protein